LEAFRFCSFSQFFGPAAQQFQELGFSRMRREAANVAGEVEEEWCLQMPMSMAEAGGESARKESRAMSLRERTE